MTEQGVKSLQWARIEYQPNLKVCADPIALGVVVEERSPNSRGVCIVGRIPMGDASSHPELQLEGAWGPFAEILRNWVDLLAKDVRESIASSDKTVLDDLTTKWQYNLYIRQPEAVDEGLHSQSLGQIAKTLCKEYIQEGAISREMGIPAWLSTESENVLPLSA